MARTKRSLPGWLKASYRKRQEVPTYKPKRDMTLEEIYSKDLGPPSPTRASPSDWSGVWSLKGKRKAKKRMHSILRTISKAVLQERKRER